MSTILLPTVGVWPLGTEFHKVTVNHTQSDSQSVQKLNTVRIQKHPTRFSEFWLPVLYALSFFCLEKKKKKKNKWSLLTYRVCNYLRAVDRYRT